jgi:hypothetical protein
VASGCASVLRPTENPLPRVGCANPSNAGNKDLAIQNYQRSLQLNPKNDNAVKMLAKLGVMSSVDAGAK